METEAPKRHPNLQLIADFANAIPDHVAVYLILLLAIGAAWVFGGISGADRTKAVYEARLRVVTAAYEKADDEKERASKELVKQLGTRLNAATKEKTRVETIIKEVPKYVTIQADAHCTIPAGFVWMHNTSIASEVPELAGSRPEDVDAPSGVALSTVASTVASNNAECVERGSVINAWIDWYEAQRAIFARAQQTITNTVKESK